MGGVLLHFQSTLSRHPAHIMYKHPHSRWQKLVVWKQMDKLQTHYSQTPRLQDMDWFSRSSSFGPAQLKPCLTRRLDFQTASTSRSVFNSLTVHYHQFDRVPSASSPFFFVGNLQSHSVASKANSTLNDGPCRTLESHQCYPCAKTFPLDHEFHLIPVTFTQSFLAPPSRT